MADAAASPADPIFWMHHANIDPLWWSWQIRDLKKRMRDVSGPLILADFNNEHGGNATLDTPLSLGYGGWKSTVADVMDIANLCYIFDETY